MNKLIVDTLYWGSKSFDVVCMRVYSHKNLIDKELQCCQFPVEILNFPRRDLATLFIPFVALCLEITFIFSFLTYLTYVLLLGT